MTYRSCGEIVYNIIYIFVCCLQVIRLLLCLLAPNFRGNMLSWIVYWAVICHTNWLAKAQECDWQTLACKYNTFGNYMKFSLLKLWFYVQFIFNDMTTCPIWKVVLVSFFLKKEKTFLGYLVTLIATQIVCTHLLNSLYISIVEIYSRQFIN